MPLLPRKHSATANSLLKGLAVHLKKIQTAHTCAHTHADTHSSWLSLQASSTCHTDLEINQTEKRQWEGGRGKEEGSQGQVRGPPARQPEGPRENTDIGSQGPLKSPLDHTLNKYWDWNSNKPKCLCVCCVCACVSVCKPLKQMVRDVRLRQTIDFRKQISSLVKQKAPQGPSEDRREREREEGREMGWMQGEREKERQRESVLV